MCMYRVYMYVHCTSSAYFLQCLLAHIMCSYTHTALYVYVFTCVYNIHVLALDMFQVKSL